MAYTVPPFTFEFATSRIMSSPALDVIDLYRAIQEARASEEGILYDTIGTGSGLVDLGEGTRVGLTCALVGSWQVKFPEGNYIARVGGGNLVGGPGGDPIAYSAGVQVLLIQSAASTVVEVSEGGGGSSPSPSQIAAAVWTNPQRTLTSPNPIVLEPGERLVTTQDGHLYSRG